MKKLLKENGITLIALTVTIIVLLILAGITITYVFGEDGIIAQAQLAAFATEMQGIKERVDMKKVGNITAILIDNSTAEGIFTTKFGTNSEDYKIKDTLKREILYVRDGMPEGKTPDDYDVAEFEELLDEEGNIKGIYVIDKETGNGKENTYIYDETTDVVFKIPQTVISRKIYHSYECLMNSSGGGLAGGDSPDDDGTIKEESGITTLPDVVYYAPDLKGFSSSQTYVVYYSADFSKTKPVLASEYMAGGQKREITEAGETYTLHDYGTNKIWANIKTEGLGLESWWVWIPRFAYKVSASGKSMDIVYVGTDNKPLDSKVSIEGYETHPAFTVDGNELKGIWMSKYEASYADYPTSGKVLAPDMSGFNKANTRIMLYDSNSETGFKGEGVLLSDVMSGDTLTEQEVAEINKENKWYDYENQVWANIKCKANGQESWWVWVPRYAYRMSSSPVGNVIDVIYVDTNDKPLDKKFGTVLPDGFELHPAFDVDGNKLKGIWISKYEASYADYPTSGKVLVPDMSGFDKANTRIMLYDSSSETGFKGEGLLLSDVMSGDTLTEQEVAEINKENKWYDYENQVWANIKCKANGQESWWVWVPRYAYRMSSSPVGNVIDVIYVDTDNTPLDKEKYGEKLPDGFELHPAFDVEGNKLKGIWMSKYEASQVP